LHEAAKHNYLDIVQYLVEEMNEDFEEAKDPETNKLTPMSIAISRGNLEVA